MKSVESVLSKACGNGVGNTTELGITGAEARVVEVVLVNVPDTDADADVVGVAESFAEPELVADETPPSPPTVNTGTSAASTFCRTSRSFDHRFCQSSSPWASLCTGNGLWWPEVAIVANAAAAVTMTAVGRRTRRRNLPDRRSETGSGLARQGRCWCILGGLPNSTMKGEGEAGGVRCLEIVGGAKRLSTGVGV